MIYIISDEIFVGRGGGGGGLTLLHDSVTPILFIVHYRLTTGINGLSCHLSYLDDTKNKNTNVNDHNNDDAYDDYLNDNNKCYCIIYQKQKYIIYSSEAITYDSIQSRRNAQWKKKIIKKKRCLYGILEQHCRIINVIACESEKKL